MRAVGKVDVLKDRREMPVQVSCCVRKLGEDEQLVLTDDRVFKHPMKERLELGVLIRSDWIGCALHIDQTVEVRLDIGVEFRSIEVRILIFSAGLTKGFEQVLVFRVTSLQILEQGIHVVTRRNDFLIKQLEE